jgi:hypothetical protein
MLDKIFKGKRKVKIHELVSEHSYTQCRKNLFLRRYILLIICAILFMFWLNGQFNHGNKWTYYFAINNDNKLITLNENNVPQPFKREDILDYSQNIMHQLFSLTPRTYRQNLNDLFSKEFVYKYYINKTNLALEKSGILGRVENGWYYTLKELGKPSIKTTVMSVQGEKLFAWQVTYDDFRLYGRKGDEKTEITAVIEIIIAKTPFMLAPNRLSPIRIFIRDLKDVGNKYGY